MIHGEPRERESPHVIKRKYARAAKLTDLVGNTQKVVGIFVSADEHEALIALLSVLPPLKGVVFVIIYRQSQAHEQAYRDAIADRLTFPIIEVSHEMAAEAGHVYINPP